MTSATIIISHFESLPFLEACVRQIRKYAVDSVRQEILIIDQSCDTTFIKIKELYDCSADIKSVNVSPLYSGYGLDYAMRFLNIKTDYIAQLHVDAFPISDRWLTLPIALIEESGLSFVGQLQFINGRDNLASIYPPNPFFAMAQCFNVAKTGTYKELSLQAGFTRFHNRPESKLTFDNNDWGEWAKEDYNARGSDDDVVAFHWNGKYKTDNMLGMAISGYIESGYGRIIDEIVFHFCSCREAIGVMDSMPEGYRKYAERINSDYSDILIDDMVNKARQTKPPELEILSRNLWDGKLKKTFSTTKELNDRIEQLKVTV